MTPTEALSSVAALLPTGGYLPGLRLWMEPLGVALFIVHILLVNVVLGCSIVALVKHAQGSPNEYRAAIPKALALTVNFAVACLLFTQVLFSSAAYPSSLIMGLYWLALPFVVLFAYYGLYLFDAYRKREDKGATVVLLLTVALLLAAMYLLTYNNHLIFKPQLWMREYTNHPGGALSVPEWEIIPRYLHNVFASVAVGGLCLAWMDRRRWKKGTFTGTGIPEHKGLHWYLYGTIAQMIVGVVYLLSLPSHILSLAVGGDPAMTACLTMGAVFGLLSLHKARKNSFRGSVVFLLLTIVCMASFRAMLRHAFIDPFYPAETDIRQYGPLALFIGSLVVALVACAWIIIKAKPYLEIEPQCVEDAS